MNILYYLEPWIEMGRPDFRFGSLKGYLHTEMKSLCESGATVYLLIGEGVDQAIRRNEFSIDSRINIRVIRQKHLEKIYPNYRVATANHYRQTVNSASQEKYKQLYFSTFGGFSPDLIVAWETPINFLKKIYPKATVLHATYGLFSRSPFPEMQMYDHLGIFSQGFYTNGSKLIKRISADADNLKCLHAVREAYSKALLKSNPFSNMDLKDAGRFEFVILLPLQVSNYFSFDENCNFVDQFDYVRSVLERIDPRVRLVVTEHSSWRSIFDESNLSYLRKKYKNFFYHKKFSEYKFCSQLLLPYVDGVLTVSSSVGLISLLMGKPLFTVGESHMTSFSSSRVIEKIYGVLKEKKYRNYDDAMSEMIFRWNIPMREYVHKDKWLYGYFSLLLKNIKSSNPDPFPMVDEVRNLADFYIEYSKSYNGPKKLASTIKIPIKSNSQTNIIFSNQVELGRDKVVRIIEDLNRDIYKFDVIGFDIFDTLLIRSEVSNPKDVFDIVGKKINEKLSIDLHDFRGKRVEAEKSARKFVNKDEVCLREIYSHLLEKSQIDLHYIEDFCRLEEEVEYELAQPRKLLVDIYKKAIGLGKSIYIVTDIYHSEDFIKRLLNKIGVTEYKKLYISSVVGMQKHSGKLFELIKAELSEDEKYLHVGDNPRSDYGKPVHAGLEACLVPAQRDIVKGSSGLANIMPADTRLRASVETALVDELKWNAISGSISSSDPKMLGYLCLGPLLTGFSQWLHKEVKTSDIKKLNFLSREGQIFKKAFDQLQNILKEKSCDTQYVYCSRRSVNLAAISSIDDAKRVGKAPSSDRTIKDFLINRFGFSEGEVRVNMRQLDSIGIRDEQFLFNPRKQPNLTDSIVETLYDKICINVAREKQPLIEYYKEVSLCEEKSAIVDIGYKGTMQSSIELLMGKSSKGLYLITFKAALDLLGKSSQMSGYLGDFVDHTINDHPFCKYIPTIEFMLLADHPSFKRAVFKNKSLFFEFQKGVKESDRERLVKQLQEGALLYLSRHGKIDHIDSGKSFQPLLQFLTKPNYFDAKILEDYALEDNYGGNNSRYICSKSNIVSSVWKEGSAVLQGTKLVREYRVSKKFKKLIESPYYFFNDSRVYPIRAIRYFFKRA